jgi:hypothetical protein
VVSIHAQVHPVGSDADLLEHRTHCYTLLAGVVDYLTTQLEDTHSHTYGRLGHGTEYSNSQGSFGS